MSAQRVSTESKLWLFALERLNRRARTDAPMFLMFLAIGGQGLDTGPDHGGNPSVLRLTGNLCRRGSALAQCLLESFKCNRQTH